jgi:hypothetical protein
VWKSARLTAGEESSSNTSRSMATPVQQQRQHQQGDEAGQQVEQHMGECRPAGIWRLRR